MDHLFLDQMTPNELKLLSIPWLRRLTMSAFLSVQLSILASTSLHSEGTPWANTTGNARKLAGHRREQAYSSLLRRS